MPLGKHTSHYVVGLLLGLAFVGCRTLNQRNTAPVRTPPPAPTLRPPVDTQPAPPLQIPNSPPASAPQAATPGAENPAPLNATASAGTTAVTPPAPTNAGNPLRRLYDQAQATYGPLTAYSARLRQREQVNGRDKPEEVMLCKFRKQPWSVYFKWVGKEAQGREVIYVKGQFDGKIHTRLAAGDVVLMPAGMRFSVDPESVLARGRSRHPITEAGIGSLIDHFGRLLAAAEQGDTRHGTFRYFGTQTRPDLAVAVETVEQTIPPGAEPALPNGGRRTWGFATDSHLPVLIVTQDDRGHEVEYYCYDQLQYPVQFSDDDFNPDRLWARR